MFLLTEGKIKRVNKYQIICSKCKQQRTVRGDHIIDWITKHHYKQDLTDLTNYTNNNLCHSCSMICFNSTKRNILELTRFEEYQATCSKCGVQRIVKGKVIYNWLNRNHKQSLMDYYNGNLCHSCLFKEVHNRPDVKVKRQEVNTKLEVKAKRSKIQKEVRNRLEFKAKLKEILAKPEIKAKVSRENNCQWLGGKSFEPYTPEFNKALKEQIRKRDNRTCQLCGVLECECLKQLSVHHIDYVKKNMQPDNLISLCTNCHTKTNHNRKYWIKRFQEASRTKQTFLSL